MGRMKRHHTRRAWHLAAVAAAALASGLVAPRAAGANASGCTLHPKSYPDDSARCFTGGDGCYLCEYSDPDGYMTCSESPDGTTMYCIPGQQAQNQYSGDRSGPQGPLSPAGGRAVSSGGLRPTGASRH